MFLTNCSGGKIFLPLHPKKNKTNPNLLMSKSVVGRMKV